ncbi:MAG: hypothetical protein ACFE9O_12225 [Promethearchaeota archaeon]
MVGKGDAVEFAGFGDEEDKAAVEVVVCEVGPVGSWGGDGGTIVELEGALSVSEGGEGGEDGGFAGDFIEDVVVVVVLG